MVAPKQRRRKWRFHCSTCGGPLAGAPKTWAYCSKDCERDREGRRDLEAMPTAAVDRYFQLAHELESRLPQDQHDRIRAEMLQLQSQREDVVKREMFTSERMEETVAEFWVNPIRREADRFELAMRRSLTAAIKLGAVLLEAKQALAHGQFGRLFKDHAAPVEGAMPFSGSWANRLMRLASHGVIVNPKRASVLPPDLDTVCRLARLDEGQLEQAIESGVVHPRMRRDEVRALLPATGPDEPVSDDDALVQLLDPFRLRLARFAADRPTMLQELRSRLTAMLRAVERAVEGDAQ